MTDITVIGLGAMGSALARVLVQAGFSVTVWNRTTEKTAPLAAIGAVAATDLGQALNSSSKVIFCLPGYDATDHLLASEGAAGLLAGRTIVQLSTASPKEAQEAESRFSEQGASFLAGAILCWPGNIGTDGGRIVIGGAERAFDACRSELEALAGDLRYLGTNIKAPSTVDIAFLSRTLGIIFGSIHGALACEAEGVPVSEFTAILPPGDRAVSLTETIASGSYEDIGDAAASVDIAWAAVRQLKQQAADAGINSDLPDLMANWVSRAQSAGFGSQDTAAIFKALRS